MVYDMGYGMVWYGMVWYGMVWYGMVWYGMVCGVDVPLQKMQLGLTLSVLQRSILS